MRGARAVHARCTCGACAEHGPLPEPCKPTCQGCSHIHDTWQGVALNDTWQGVAPTQRQLELLQLARPAKRLCRAVVVGLDGVGKTSILTALRTGRVAPNSLLQTPAEDVAPTQGCNKSALYRDDVSGRWTPESGDHASFGLELLDVGGGSGERQHWPQLAVGSTAILAVVDGRETDAARCSSWS